MMNEHVMHSKNDNIEMMINDREDEVTEEVFNHFFLEIKLGWKYQWKIVT